MRVFFLGAGASKAMANLPIMVEFFDDFNQDDAISYWALNWFIKQNEDLFSDDNKRKINLEKLFNYLFLCLNSPASIYAEKPLDFSEKRLFVVDKEVLNRGAKKEKEAYYYAQQKPTTKSFLLNVQEQLEGYMIKKLHSNPGIGAEFYESEKPKESGRVKKFIEKLGDKDCIITTNYDLLMDWALKKYKKDMWKRSQKLISGKPLSPEERNKGVYLKLHGSLNWFVCSNKECPNHFRIFVKEKIDESYYCERCGGVLKRLIVPPIFYKNLQEYPKLGFIWDIAFERLSKAEEIVFYGFSFTSSDLPISWLIRETYRKRKRETDSDAYEEYMQQRKINERQGDESEKPIKTLEELTLPKIVIINPDKNVTNKAKEWLGSSNPKRYDKIL